MGQAMAGRLVAAGHDVILYNRTAGKLSSLVEHGARAATTIAESARYAGVVLSMLADDTALRAVAEGSGGLIESLPAGGIHVAMGTHDVEYIRALATAHAGAKQSLISAPVLGRPAAVAAGQLGIIVAGNADAVSRCLPLFNAIGRRVYSAGPNPDSAATMKLANNFLLACAIEALGEAFSLVEKCGVASSVFHSMITDGLFACPAYNTYAKIIADKAWDTVGFTVLLALKDIDLALAAGDASGVPLPSANICRNRLLSAISHGEGQRDWAVMALEQARASGLS
jgi:3-hydroxyisobutyrate dehydrogenase-like beta-hydroxyacid dehydrogenase